MIQAAAKWKGFLQPIGRRRTVVRGRPGRASAWPFAGRRNRAGGGAIALGKSPDEADKPRCGTILRSQAQPRRRSAPIGRTAPPGPRMTWPSHCVDTAIRPAGGPPDSAMIAALMSQQGVDFAFFAGRVKPRPDSLVCGLVWRETSRIH